MDKKFYSTRHLNIAAFLYASRLELFDVDNLNGDFFFKFRPYDKAEKLVEDYYLGSASINPRELFDRLRDLKDLIFSSEQEGKNGR